MFNFEEYFLIEFGWEINFKRSKGKILVRYCRL